MLFLSGFSASLYLNIDLQENSFLKLLQKFLLDVTSAKNSMEASFFFTLKNLCLHKYKINLNLSLALIVHMSFHKFYLSFVFVIFQQNEFLFHDKVCLWLINLSWNKINLVNFPPNIQFVPPITL